MNPNKKVLITISAFVLAMLVIACSCSTLIPTPTVAPPPTATSLPPNPMPGLEGTWHNPDTGDVFVFAWQAGQYMVVSCTWNGTSYQIVSQSWDGSSLIWSYTDTDLNLTVTLQTVSLNGDNLDVNWSLSDGTSGGSTLLRGDATTVSPSTGNQEAIPGLAGSWQDPETTDTFVIAWENGQYVVLSVTWEGTTYQITSQSWDGSSLTWSYYDTDLPMTVTYTTTSLNGDSLYVDWSYSNGNSGTETLGRVQ